MEVDILECAWKDILKGLPFCIVCFKTSKEVRLVKPRHVQNFAKQFHMDIISLKPSLVEPSMSACYMCEAQAASALKFHAAVQNAVASRLVLNRHGGQKTVMKKREIDLCNKRLREFRAKSTLRQTEVLIVDSNAGQWTFKKSTSTAADDAKNTSSNVPPQSKPDLETVVLDDDDEETIVPPKPPEKILSPEQMVPKLVPLDQVLDSKNKNLNYAAIVPNQQQIISRHPCNKNNYLLHPIVTDDKGCTVATLSAKLVNGQLVYHKAPTLTIFNGVVIQNQTAPTDAIILNNTENSYESKTEVTQNGVAQKSAPLRVNKTLQALLNSKSNMPTKPMNQPTKEPTDNVDNIIDKILQDKLVSLCNKSKRPSENAVENVKKPKNVSSNKVDLETVQSMLNDAESNVLAPTENNMVLPFIFEVKSQSRSRTQEPFACLTKMPGLVTIEGPKSLAISDVRSEATEQDFKSGKVDWEDKIPMDLISYVGSNKVQIEPTKSDEATPNEQASMPVRMPSKAKDTIRRMKATPPTTEQVRPPPTNQGTSIHALDPTIIDLC